MSKSTVPTYQKTRYPGVFERHLLTGDVVYYAFYRLEGKLIKDKIGEKSRGWSAKAASGERALRLAGKSDPTVQRRNKAKAQQDAEQNRWTFDRLFAHYCELNPNLRRLPTDKGRFRNHLQKRIGGKTPKELTALEVQRIKKQVEDAKLSKSSIWHVLELIRRMSNFAEKQGLAGGLSFRLKLDKVNNEKTENLTPAQLSGLHKILSEESTLGNTAALMIRLVLATGMRRGELFGLQWRDIEDDHIVLREPKGGVNVRIPINSTVQLILELIPRTGSDFIFPGKKGKQRVDAKKALETIKRKAGLPKDFRILHGCRHVFASTGVSNGIDLYTMQHLLTHKSAAMTQRYAHLADDYLRRASERTAAILAGETNPSVVNLEAKRRERSA